MQAEPVDFELGPQQPVLVARSVNADAFAEPEADMHEAFEVGVILEGRVELTFGDVVVSTTRGQLWLTAPWEPHAWRVAAPGTSHLSVHFLPGFLGEETFEGQPWLSVFAVPPADRHGAFNLETCEQILSLAYRIAQEGDQRSFAWCDAVRLRTLDLLLILTRNSRHSGRSGGQTTTMGLARILPAIRLVQSDPTRRVPLAEAAAACGLARCHFDSVFRNSMGMPFGRFALRIRLARAAHLLAYTSHTVEAIADAIGFSDASHLHHSFATVYGCTPGEYRRLRGV